MGWVKGTQPLSRGIWAVYRPHSAVAESITGLAL